MFYVTGIAQSSLFSPSAFSTGSFLADDPPFHFSFIAFNYLSVPWVHFAVPQGHGVSSKPRTQVWDRANVCPLPCTFLLWPSLCFWPRRCHQLPRLPWSHLMSPHFRVLPKKIFDRYKRWLVKPEDSWLRKWLVFSIWIFSSNKIENKNYNVIFYQNNL